MFKIYRENNYPVGPWKLRGRSGELGPYDHVVAKDVMFKTRKRNQTGYAEATEARVVGDTRLLDARIVFKDGTWVFEATGRAVVGTMPTVVFNRTGVWLHAGAIHGNEQVLSAKKKI